IQRTAIRGTDTDLQLQGSIPMLTDAPASLLLVGTVDLQVAKMFDPDITSSGQIRFNIDSYGRANPDVQGQIEIVNASFATADFPAGFENGNGVLKLTRNRVELQQAHGTIGGGTVTLTGGVTYRPAVQFNLAVTGR